MKRTAMLPVLACMISVFFLSPIVASAASGLKIGVAKVKITPEEPTILGGYTHGTDALCNPANDILDDIYCRIMVAEDGSGNREVFLSVDVCAYMESDYYDPYNGVGVWWPKTVPSGTNQRFADAGNVALNRVFVSATHTHQASEQLAEKYIQRILDGINTAKNNMVPVNIGYANTTYDINVNRRPDYGVHPNLECDKSLTVVIFRNATDNTPVASVVNYAIHNTGIGTGGNGYDKCSSELTGIAMNKIESNFGGNFLSLFIQGFEGDVGPCINGARGAIYSTVVATGNTFGQDCTNILNGINVNSNTASVNGTTSSQVLPTKAGWGVSTQSISFSGARIGDICFIGGSGEIFNQMAISLRLQAPFGAIVTAAIVNGYSGYVPTLSGFFDGVGGAEVTSKTPWTSTIENTFMTEMSKIVSSLAGGTSKVGYSSVGSNSESSSANNFIISKFNAGANMTLSSLKIYVQNATGNVRMGLFSDNGTDTPVLLQQTGEITLANGWNEGAIISTNITPGTYWIGFLFNSNGNIIYYDKRKLGSYQLSYAYGSLPSAPSGMSWGGGMYSVYAGNGGTTVPVTGVFVNPTSASIYANATQQLTATVIPLNASIKTVSWSSSNSSVATVNSSGLVTGIAVGNANITATTLDGSKIATSAITVSNSVMVTGVSVSPASATIPIEATQLLTATVSPSNATNQTVSWSSSNTSVATVNNTGVVLGITTGQATITATTQDGGKTATSIITVNAGDGSIIGLNTAGADPENGDIGYWIGSSFTASSNITVNRMNLYVSNAIGNARLGIYSSSSGEPGTLLAQTGEITLIDGWNSGLLGTAQNLTAGVTYYLALEVNSAITTIYYNTIPGRLRYKSTAYGSLPSPAPLNCTIGAAIYSIYADDSNSGAVRVTGVTISPTSANISVNATQQLTATVSPSNATNKIVSWSSSNTSVATVNATGLVTGVAAGSATITATTQDGAKKAICVITVSSNGVLILGLNAVGVIPETGDNGYWISSSFTASSNFTVNRMNLYVTTAAGNARLGIYTSSNGEPGALLAQTGEIPLSNGWNSGLLGTAQNIISGVTYFLAIEVSSSATTLQYNSVAGRLRYKPTAYGSLPSPAPLNCISGAGIYSVFADNNGVVTVPVTGVTVSPTSATIPVDATQQLTATVLPSNATNKTVSWSSSNTSFATVNSTGLVTGIAAGSATITATTQDGGKTTTSVITVTSNGVTVLGLNAIGDIPETGDNGYWISSSFTATSNFTVNRMNLYVTTATGNARLGIYASSNGEPGTLLAQTGEIPLSNGWNSGLLGTAQNLISGVTYFLAIEVSSSATTLRYNSVAGRLRYKSIAYGSLPSPAPLNCISGEGVYSVFADNNGVVTVPVTGVTVSPTSATIPVDATQQLTATVLPSNATNKTVSWSSSNTSVATVNATGLVTGVTAGSATITVTTLDGGKTAASVITVSNSSVSILGLNTIGDIPEAYDNGYWISSSFTANSNFTVNRMNLYVTTATGNARLGIYASSNGEPGALLAQTGVIPLSNGWNSGVLGTAQNLISGITYWLAIEVSSSATTLQFNEVAGRLRYKGYAFGSMPSPAPLNCISGAGIYSVYADNNNVVTVPVTGVTVSPTSATINVNGTQQLTATVSPTNATNKTVSWSSGNTAVATVNTSGLVTGVAAGTATITVTTQDGGKTASSVITVNAVNVPVTGVSVSPTTASIPVNGTQQLSATVSPSNATNKTVSWSSGNTSVATVSTSGLVTGIAIGNAIITVTTLDGGKTATSVISVVSTSGSYLGYNVTGPADHACTAGDMNASQFTAGSSFTATSMYISLSSAVTGRLKGAIYSDNGGRPYTKLGETTEITNPTSGGFKKLTGLNVSIRNGTKYWLVIWGNVNYSVDCATSGGALRWKSRTYGSWPTTFPNADGSSTLKFSIYVDGLKSAFLSESNNLSESVIENDYITDSQNNFMVFPNPSNKGILYVNFASVNESATLKIIDLTGHVIYNKTFVNFNGTQQLDISNLSKGLYLINVVQGKAYYHTKLIIE